MKKICYNAVVRYIGKMRNDGFIVVEIENDKIFSVDGMFTNEIDSQRETYCNRILLLGLSN